MLTDVQKLDTIINEAEQILARNDGVHIMHCCMINLRTWRENMDLFDLDEEAWVNIDHSIKWMRTHDKG